MASVNHQNLTEKNAEYAASFKQGDLDFTPAKKYTIVTCMDARLDPISAFGITLGDAHVIRNAGGSAREALRSIIISQQFFGTNEVFLIKHTGCSMLTFENEGARDAIGRYLGDEAAEEVKEMDFLTFKDLKGEVKKDVEWLRGQKVIASSVAISGWIYDVKTGKVEEVEEAKAKI